MGEGKHRILGWSASFCDFGGAFCDGYYCVVEQAKSSEGKKQKTDDRRCQAYGRSMYADGRGAFAFIEGDEYGQERAKGGEYAGFEDCKVNEIVDEYAEQCSKDSGRGYGGILKCVLALRC